jgi:hypothetical protein
MNFKEIPKWLFGASFFVLVLLMSLSLFTGSPFMIHGQAWGWQQSGKVQEIPSELLSPIGSIVAWDKGEIAKDLPSGWVECNGQLIHDKKSSYHNKQVPNINNKGLFLRGGEKARIEQEGSLSLHAHQIDLTVISEAIENHSHDYSFRVNTESNGIHRHDNGSVSSGHSSYQLEYAPYGVASTHSAKSPVVGKWPNVPLKTGYTSNALGHEHRVSYSGSTDASGQHSHEVRINGDSKKTGENETRPKNISFVWIIRIK